MEAFHVCDTDSSHMNTKDCKLLIHLVLKIHLQVKIFPMSERAISVLHRERFRTCYPPPYPPSMPSESSFPFLLAPSISHRIPTRPPFSQQRPPSHPLLSTHHLSPYLKQQILFPIPKTTKPIPTKRQESRKSVS